MAGKRGDTVRTQFYDPQIMGKLEYASNPTRNRVMLLTRFYLNHLTQMAANRFTWTGLPKEVDVRFLEMTLLQRGLCVFFEEKEKYNQFLVMRAGQLGELNIYDNPSTYTVQGGTGNLYLSQTLDQEDCVPIWSNYLRTAEFPNLQLWATRLADADRTIEIAVRNARQTKLVSVPEAQRHSAVQVLQQMAEGVETVMGTEELSQIAKSIETIDLESHPSKLMNLLISKGKIWNEIMTFMGVNNSNQDKKERLVSDEVAANDEQIDLVKEMFLSTRRKAAEDISEKFGLKVSVEFNQSAFTQIDGANQGISSNAVPKQNQSADWSG